MKITLYNDETLELSLECIVDNLNRLATNLRFTKGRSKFSIKGFFVFAPDSYQQISRHIERECADSNEVMLFTEKAYDTNYFWESDNKNTIISLSGWEHLTTLPRNNGAVYFICALLVRFFGIGKKHLEKNTGCINDFLQDKAGIDFGMRSAFICPDCLKDFKKRASKNKKKLLEDIENILDDLSIASRSNIDICDYWDVTTHEQTFDVFMCHNSEDKDDVRQMNNQLKKHGIKTWFDEEQLPPGRLWQDLLEEQIEQIKTAAVFVGNNGIGPWQHIEIRAFLQEFVRRRCPVIPIVLPDCSKVPKLPLFLSQLTWVDFRKIKPDPIQMLLWGITGKKP